MSFTEDEAAVLSAEELLTVDEGQLVRYMERNACADGGFDISSSSGFERSSRHQRDELETPVGSYLALSLTFRSWAEPQRNKSRVQINLVLSTSARS
jgi:hypothetical protein